MTTFACRHCAAPLEERVLDLGHSAPSNAYLTREMLSAPEITYPLRVAVCSVCLLVQTEDFTDVEALFSPDYAYLSSTSRSWMEHAASYAAMITDRLSLTSESLLIELASNDGYLLENFVRMGIPCLGIEPTESTARVADSKGIQTMRAFFGKNVAAGLVADGRRADLVIGNNVYAHVPDINDFTRGIAAVLKPEGVVTLEFPHVMRLLQSSQFDTVYHEHFSYHSLLCVSRIFAAAGLRIFDVEELGTHGGSLRVYGCLDTARRTVEPSVAEVSDAETRAGLDRVDTYRGLQSRAERIKNELVAFLIDAKARGKRVAAYGAAAKGNTLLNFAGVRPDLLPFVCDAAETKQGKFMPGSHIPILAPDVLADFGPDYVLILPWNIAPEIRRALAPLADGGTRFVTAVPELVVS